MKIYLSIFIFLIISSFSFSQRILIEAESFDDKGGWIVDQQSYDQLGSYYLMAHGNVIPVQNATKQIHINKAGKYYVYVKTRNWVANWFKNDEYAPGVFQLSVDGKNLDVTFGDSGEEWHWQSGGTVSLSEGNHNLELIDLTGFGARCDAILFTTNKNDKVLLNNRNLTEYRDQIFPVKTVDEQYDLIVVGAGIAGLSAAIAASRNGLKTALIHNRPVVGGNNSKEIQVVISGEVMQKPFEKLGGIVHEIGNIYKNPQKVLTILKEEENLDLFINTQVTNAIVSNNRINQIIAQNIEDNSRLLFSAKLFADCTGDGNLGYYAGAKFMIGRETRHIYNETLAPEIESKFSYGSTLKWKASQGLSESSFPELPWAIQFTELNFLNATEGTWTWETGFYKDQVKDAEIIRDYMLRVIYGNWSYLKNSDTLKTKYKNWKLDFVSPILGKRESRRLVGDVVFTQNDIEGEWKKYSDAFVIGTYPIDQHFPSAENSIYFPGEEFQSNFKHDHYPIGYDLEFKHPKLKQPPYYIPYRSLYSNNIENLFMAGRNISCSRIAFCSTRVQGTTGMMGELVGRAASVCIEKMCTPREVYTKYLELLRSKVLKNEE